MTKRKPLVLVKSRDLEFNYVLTIDPEIEPWRAFAAVWFDKQIGGRAGKRLALDKFLCNYLPQLGPAKFPQSFFLRNTKLPELKDQLQGTQPKGVIKIVNHVHDFLNWILGEAIAVEDDHGRKVIPAEFHNPIPRLKGSGIVLSETVRTPLPYRYIKELRDILCPGEHFSDWKWAHQAVDHNTYGDWFEVDPGLIDKNDPDCVWRTRKANVYNKDYYAKSGGPYRLGSREIHEIWSPVRAMVIYVKLQLPLRTTQVRMLDSGEADTWRYENGSWKLNDHPLAQGTVKTPIEKGVFRRIVNPEDGKVLTGFFINTNKTADIYRAEQEKGYVIPWQHDSVLYWLEKLRNWQERYNPIKAPVPWTELELKHIGEIKSDQVLTDKGNTCFLFRDAAACKDIRDRAKPITLSFAERMWFHLLSELETRCAARGETLKDGSPLSFVKPGSYATTHFPLHSLRVSLITAYALEGGVPMPVLSKLIAGHARLIMTIYYVKAGVAHVTELMGAAEKRILETDQQSFRRFLANASYDQIESRAAFNTPDALSVIIQKKSTASMVVEDRGICPMGGSGCDCGGEQMNEAVVDQRQRLYAPVPGYPLEKNCVRCRFFITGPAFLPGLQAHFNSISFQLSECSTRYVSIEEQIKDLEDYRQACDEKSIPFAKSEELNKLYRLYEQEAQKADKLANDLNATLRLIDRCVKLLEQPESNDNSLKLVPAGGISDVKWALMETHSDLHQLEVICENAVFYLEIDASKAILRRSQILDAMLMMNGQTPVFLRLTPDQQLRVGNELMALIKARTGSLKGAVEFIEGGARLKEFGLLDDAINLLGHLKSDNNLIKVNAKTIQMTVQPAMFDKTGETI
jgi:hypothetical protein